MRLGHGSISVAELGQDVLLERQPGVVAMRGVALMEAVA